MLHLKLLSSVVAAAAAATPLLVFNLPQLPAPSLRYVAESFVGRRKTKSSLILIDEHKSFSVFQFFGLHCCNNQMIEHLRSGAVARAAKQQFVGDLRQDEHGWNGRGKWGRGREQANSTHLIQIRQLKAFPVPFSCLCLPTRSRFAMLFTLATACLIFHTPPPHTPNHPSLQYTIHRFVHRCSRARLFVARNLFTVRIGSEFRLRHTVRTAVSRDGTAPHTYTHAHSQLQLVS